jgi:predicted extracellular nuclease
MTYRIGFWNLANLFAPENFPDREPWIANAVASDLSGWTEALFRRKVAQLASVITQLANGAGPDILGVCEVENRFVLDALVGEINARLPARRYGVVHADTAPRTTAVSTLPLSSIRTASRSIRPPSFRIS